MLVVADQARTCAVQAATTAPVVLVVAAQAEIPLVTTPARLAQQTQVAAEAAHQQMAEHLTVEMAALESL